MNSDLTLARWGFRLAVVVCIVLIVWVARRAYEYDDFLLGLATTLTLSLLVSPLVSWARYGWPVRPPSGLEFMMEGRRMPGPLMIGVLEAAVLYVAFWHAAWSVAAGWLVFKAASKWASWQHVMRLPENVESKSDEWNTDYLRFRWAWSSEQLISFLFGTLANVAAALVGLMVAQV